MTMKIAIKKVDAFTTVPLAGNPAGVVADAAHLSPAQMQLIAREMAVPETAFILPPSEPGADLRIRWFTPTTEVDLCGHATVASFHAMAEEGMHGMSDLGTYAFRLETRSGILPVTVEKRRDGITVFFGLPVPEFARASQFKLDLARLLDLPADEFESRMPIVMERYLYVPLRRLHALFTLKPNMQGLAQFLVNRGLHGLCAFTTETVEQDSAVHSRFFAPNEGIDEDPVPGSANGPLGVYLFERGEIEPLGNTATLVGEQGDAIGRPGRVTIQLALAGKRVASVQIGGRAVTVLEGELLVPENIPQESLP
jgi:trans-2,3-dihydro-3-hydroxyanthranilate isomerase